MKSVPVSQIKEGARYRFLYRHTFCAENEIIVANVRSLDYHGAIRVTISDGKSSARSHDHRNHYLDPASIVRVTPMPPLRARLAI